MTAGTKALLLLSVLGLVVLVAWFGNDPASMVDTTTKTSTRPSDPLLVSTSGASSSRTKTPSRASSVDRAALSRASAPVSTPPRQQAPAAPSRSVTTSMSRSSSQPPAVKSTTLEMGKPLSDTLAARAAEAKAAIARARESVSSSSPASTPAATSRKKTSAGSTPAKPAAKKASSKPAAAGPGTHVVKPGDTMGHLSQRYYGSARHWNRIADANPGVDAEWLRVGQELKIPAAPARQVTSSSRKTIKAPDGRTHTIDDGETLSSIAEDQLGHTKHWYRIYEANRERIGSDPDRLVVGMVIAIPS